MKKPTVADRDIIFYQFDQDIGFWGIPHIERRVHYYTDFEIDYWVKHNEFGNRDIPYQGRNLHDSIVCLGGSNTWGSGVNQHERFTDFLQKKTTQSVVNAAHNSLGLDQICLTLMKKIDQYNPCVVIIEQYPWALHRILNTYVNGYLKPIFYLDKTGELKLAKIPFAACFKSYRYCVGAYRTYLKELKEFAAGIDLKSEYDPMRDPIFLLWKTHYYSYMYRLAGKILVAIRDYCAQRRIKLLFVILPIVQQFKKKIAAPLVDYDLPMNRFCALLKANSIAYFNAAIPLIAQHRSSFPVIQPDGHLNPLGHRIVADYIWKELKKQRML